ncbi:hypothetical protein [Neisseria sicca]
MEKVEVAGVDGEGEVVLVKGGVAGAVKRDVAVGGRVKVGG